MRVRLTFCVVVVALFGALGVVAPASTASAAAAVSIDSVDLLERADAGSAIALARQVGQPVEVTGLRTESSDTSANPDGTFGSRFFMAPVRVRRGDGWTSIDTMLRLNPDGSVSPTATVADLTFSGGGTGPAIRLAKAGRGLSLSWPGVLPIPSLTGDTALYAEVLPGVDLLLRALPDGFSQLLVVKNQAAAANPAVRSVRWAATAPGLSLRGEGRGRFAAVDAGGVPVIVGPESYMWDSSAPAAREGTQELAGLNGSAGRRQVQLGVTVDAGGLTVTADAGMLADPTTVFPVFIDPTVNFYSTSWTHVNQGAPSTSYWSSNRSEMRVGLEYGTSSNVWRTILRFGIGSITNQGQQILSATFHSLLDHSASCPATSVDLWWTDWIDAGAAVTWNNTNSFGNPSGFWNLYLDTEVGNANEAGGCGGLQPDMWMEWEGNALRDAVQGTANGTCGCLALGLKAVVENDTSKWKYFYATDQVAQGQQTYLHVTHDRPPALPTAQPFSQNDCYADCSSPAIVRTTTPTLKVAVSDPDNDSTLHTVFEVYEYDEDTDATTFIVDNSASPVTTGSPGTATWAVPGGKLINGRDYQWRARTFDAYLSSGWTVWQDVEIDMYPPTVTTVTSTQYPYKQWGATVGTAGTFQMRGSSDVDVFAWWVDGGSATTVTAQTFFQPSPFLFYRYANITFTPSTDMVHTLHVKNIDGAGNVSAVYDHQFWVKSVPNRCWNWRLNETSGTTAVDSGNTDPNDGVCAPIGSTVAAMPGTLSGSGGFAAGYHGNAASFTGSGGQIVTSGPVLDTTKSFTVMAWVKPSNLAAATAQTVLSQDGVNASRFVLRFEQAANGGAGGWCFGLRANDTAAASTTSACADGSVWGVPAQGSWVHVAGVYDATAGKIRVYVMGDPLECGGETTEVTVSGSWTASGSFVIGRAKGSTAESWRGMVDQVYAHQRILSATEICQQAIQ